MSDLLDLNIAFPINNVSVKRRVCDIYHNQSFSPLAASILKAGVIWYK